MKTASWKNSYYPLTELSWMLTVLRTLSLAAILIALITSLFPIDADAQRLRLDQIKLPPGFKITVFAEDVPKGFTRAAEAVFKATAGEEAAREAFTQSVLAATAARMPLIYFLAMTKEYRPERWVY